MRCFFVAERWEQAHITIPQATKFASPVISSFHVANEIIYSDSSPQSNFYFQVLKGWSITKITSTIAEIATNSLENYKG